MVGPETSLAQWPRAGRYRYLSRYLLMLRSMQDGAWSTIGFSLQRLVERGSACANGRQTNLASPVATLTVANLPSGMGSDHRRFT